MNSGLNSLQRGCCQYYQLTKAGNKRRVLEGTYTWKSTNRKLVIESLARQEIDSDFGIDQPEENQELCIGPWTIIITSTFLPEIEPSPTDILALPHITAARPKGQITHQYRVSKHSTNRFPSLPKMIKRQSHVVAAVNKEANQAVAKVVRLLDLSHSSDQTREGILLAEAKLKELNEKEQYEELEFTDLLKDEDFARLILPEDDNHVMEETAPLHAKQDYQSHARQYNAQTLGYMVGRHPQTARYSDAANFDSHDSIRTSVAIGSGASSLGASSLLRPPTTREGSPRGSSADNFVVCQVDPTSANITKAVARLRSYRYHSPNKPLS